MTDDEFIELAASLLQKLEKCSADVDEAGHAYDLFSFISVDGPTI